MSGRAISKRAAVVLSPLPETLGYDGCMGGAQTVRDGLESLLTGERSGAAWLYDTFAGRLQRRLQLRYGYPGGLDAEDLLQDAFVFFLQHDGRVLHRFLKRTPSAEQTVARLERYLWDLACGLASNRRRSRSRSRGNVVPIIDGAAEISSSPGAERSAIDRDRLARLDACLEGRSARAYLYYKLRFHDGLSPEEIACTTGWSRKATYKLKQVLNRAVAECADQLGIGVD